MASLPDTLRRQIEKTVIAARDVAEVGARAALERLAVDRSRFFPEMPAEERELRDLLRAHARQIGDPRKESGEQEIERLVAECAYEHWHRMLFARFLAENRLLIHPEHGVPVTLAECEELATEAGEEDGWALAGRFAARMLPAIFRPGDPVLSVRLAPEHQQALEKLLAGLPVEVFIAEDSLGWVYQFWQTKRKKEVNASGKKIGADELPAVTQLFTEPYMVKFLLHNTLGAWWAGKMLAARPELAHTAASEEELRSTCALPGCTWPYLRFIRPEEGGPWRPAAGTFEGWPERAAEITVLDPCCGSGHFLVEAFRILVPLRMAEERFSAHKACDAVLRDNLFGLEIDDRCTQIAAFNLALAAWSYPDAGGYRPLRELHIACSGLSVGAKEEEWIKLVGKDERLREGMRRLYRLFKDAPTLGSLIDPRREGPDFFKAGFEELQPLLAEALAREEVQSDAAATEAGIAARGMAKAAALLAGSYTLVVTNVPYLARSKQDPRLKDHCASSFPRSKNDLATVFIERGIDSCAHRGALAYVVLQNWLFLASYKQLRKALLQNAEFNLIARLGPKGFSTPMWDFNVQLLVVTSGHPKIDRHVLNGIDVSASQSPGEKSLALQAVDVHTAAQEAQLRNPGYAITFSGVSTGRHETLGDYVYTAKGICTGDSQRFVHCFWEEPSISGGWVPFRTSVNRSQLYAGCENLLLWENESGQFVDFVRDRLGGYTGAWIRGREAWGHTGVAVSRMAGLPITIYQGELFDDNSGVLIPRDADDAAAVWCYCSSAEFLEKIRQLNQKLSVDNTYLEAIEFDKSDWLAEATRRFGDGLPKPHSDDPTQWLFHGHPLPCAFGPALEPPWPTPETLDTKRPLSDEGARRALQVAVARLLGYRWPAELDAEMKLSDQARAWIRDSEKLFDPAADSIVCIPPVRGEQPAADRLQRLLARAFGAAWTPATLPALLDQAGFASKTLEDWLRNGFFEQHCQLFHERPFVWHIWDGRRRDGFAALVNYHKLDRKLLERLAYTVLGDWIAPQRQDAKAGERGAEDRLAAAEALQKKLALILEGEPPHDIFVRWKPVEQQPIGWEPDLNDGVRMNIRPFVEAGVLRKTPRIKWSKDRGAEPESLRPRDQFPWFWQDGRFTGERVNDVHVTSATKRAARERAAGARPC